MEVTCLCSAPCEVPAKTTRGSSSLVDGRQDSPLQALSSEGVWEGPSSSGPWPVTALKSSQVQARSSVTISPAGRRDSVPGWGHSEAEALRLSSFIPPFISSFNAFEILSI